jgi:FkbM family methyltransferase
MPNDVFIGRALDLYGEYSEFEVALFSLFLKPGMMVIEVGSNIGTHTVPIAKLVGATGRVLAFEPQRVLHQYLCANIVMNGLLNVWAKQAAVGATHGMIGVPPLNYAEPNNFGGVALVDPDRAAEVVEVVTIDDFKKIAPHLIKIDCEGMEIDVLRGAAETIKVTRPVLYVENDKQDKSSALIRHIVGLGYDMWWHLPLLFNPNNWRGNKKDVFPGTGSCNMLCIPSECKAKIDGLRPVSGPEDTWNAGVK